MTDLSPTITAATLDQPALPGLELCPTGARITGVVDVPATIGHLVKLRKAGAAWRWIVGDLVLAIAETHPDGLAYAWREVADLDLDDQPSLMRSVAVARAIGLPRRREALSWSHHAAVVPLSDGEQDRWLTTAETDGLSVDAMLGLIVGDRAPLPDPEPLPLPLVPRRTVAEIEEAWNRDPAAVVVLRRTDEGVVTVRVIDAGGL